MSRKYESLKEIIPDKGMILISAWCPKGRAVANWTKFEENGNITCVVGVNGRGSLQITEEEFNEFVDCLNEVKRIRDGGEPTT